MQFNDKHVLDKGVTIPCVQVQRSWYRKNALTPYISSILLAILTTKKTPKKHKQTNKNHDKWDHLYEMWNSWSLGSKYWRVRLMVYTCIHILELSSSGRQTNCSMTNVGFIIPVPKFRVIALISSVCDNSLTFKVPYIHCT